MPARNAKVSQSVAISSLRGKHTRQVPINRSVERVDKRSILSSKDKVGSGVSRIPRVSVTSEETGLTQIVQMPRGL